MVNKCMTIYALITNIILLMMTIAVYICNFYTNSNSTASLVLSTLSYVISSIIQCMRIFKKIYINSITSQADIENNSDVTIDNIHIHSDFIVYKLVMIQLTCVEQGTFFKPRRDELRHVPVLLAVNDKITNINISKLLVVFDNEIILNTKEEVTRLFNNVNKSPPSEIILPAKLSYAKSSIFYTVTSNLQCDDVISYGFDKEYLNKFIFESDCGWIFGSSILAFFLNFMLIVAMFKKFQ